MFLTQQPKKNGFTLIEILIALFIFALIAVILMTALRSVIDAESGTEKHARRLREVQMALLLISKDMTQVVNRPVLNAVGAEEPAFIGDAHEVTFTHAGLTHLADESAVSSLERTRYVWHDHALWRVNWSAVDAAPRTTVRERKILSEVDEVAFEYLDATNHFSSTWTPNKQAQRTVPKAVRMVLTLSHWGRLSQLYVVPITSH